MWYFIITDIGFQVFEIMPDRVKPSGVFHVVEGVIGWCTVLYP